MSRHLLTARQVGDMLGVSAETVLRWTRRGELHGIRMPGTERGRLRYRPEDVDAWLNARKTSGHAGDEKAPAIPAGVTKATVSFPVPAIPLPAAAQDEKET